MKYMWYLFIFKTLKHLEENRQLVQSLSLRELKLNIVFKTSLSFEIVIREEFKFTLLPIILYCLSYLLTSIDSIQFCFNLQRQFL